MKRHVEGSKDRDESMQDEANAAAIAEGKLLPKLGKLKDVSRQRRGDILGARGAVKVQGQRYLFPRAPPAIHMCSVYCCICISCQS